MNRIEDVLYADEVAQKSSEANNMESGQTPTSTTISDLVGWEADEEDT